MPNPIIGPDQDFALWAVLLFAATLGIWADQTRWGAQISGAVVTLLVTFGLSNVGIIPVTAPSYDAVWTYLVPLAIPLLLFNADLVKIVRETGPILVAFLLGAIGTIVGTVVAYVLLPLGDEGWQLAAIFCATYIGGSVNFAATAETVGLRSGDLLSAGVAADNLVMTLYFLVLFALPSLGWLQHLFGKGQSPQMANSSAVSSFSFVSSKGDSRSDFSLLQLSLVLAFSAFVCAVGFRGAALLGIPGASILIVTILIVVIATGLSNVLSQLTLAETLGKLLMQVFFAAIGASANIGIVLRVGPILFALAIIILVIHLLFLLSAGRLLRLDLVELVVASNANTGGPTTAAAMAAARRWNRLVTPAILCGTLGYAIATFIGTALGNWLQTWSV